MELDNTESDTSRSGGGSKVRFDSISSGASSLSDEELIPSTTVKPDDSQTSTEDASSHAQTGVIVKLDRQVL